MTIGRSGAVVLFLTLVTASNQLLADEAWSVSNQWGWGPAIGDFDGDGRDDAASISGSVVYMKLSTGSDFTSTTWQSVIPNWSNYTWVGDFNGDGMADLANRVSGSQPDLISVRLSTGVGFTGHTWTVASTWGSGKNTRSGDFNGDGLDDIASIHGGNVYMKLSTGSGFTSQTWPVANQWGSGEFVFVGDYNGDGLDDIAAFGDGTAYMKLSTGSGFSSTTWSPGNSHFSNYTWVGDFNGDGLADVVNRYSGALPTLILVRLSTGSGFVDDQGWEVNGAWGSGEFSRAGDFDGDGISDVASFSGSNAYMKFKGTTTCTTGEVTVWGDYYSASGWLRANGHFTGSTCGIFVPRFSYDPIHYSEFLGRFDGVDYECHVQPVEFHTELVQQCE